MTHFATLAIAAVVLFLPPIVWASEPTAVETSSGIYLIVTGDDGVPSFVRLNVIEVDGTVPVTPVDPDDDGNGDGDDLPAGEFGLTKLAFDEARKLSAADRAKAANVATAFSPAANAATHQELVADTLKRLKAILGDNAGGWSRWYARIVVRLTELERNGKFRKIEESRAAWNEIRAGLEAVK